MRKLPEVAGLRRVSISSPGAILWMEDALVTLNRPELTRLLAEVAGNAPELLREALENRLITRVAQAVADRIAERED